MSLHYIRCTGPKYVYKPRKLKSISPKKKGKKKSLCTTTKGLVLASLPESFIIEVDNMNASIEGVKTAELRTGSASVAEIDKILLKSAPQHERKRPVPLRIHDRTEGSKHSTMVANSPIPFEVDNSVVCGKAILKVRTNDPDNVYAPYFSGRQRMFELQIQGQLKSISPDDQIYIGIQTAKPLNLSGFFTKAAAKVVLGVISSSTHNSHCTLGDNCETAQLTFPLAACVDRLAVTKHGDLPPTMGVQMFPDEFSRERRAPVEAYNTNDTYSFSMHSMYVDLVDFKLVDLPGLGSISLDTFIKGQPLFFVAYVLPKSHSGPHREQDKKYLFKFELDSEKRTVKH